MTDKESKKAAIKERVDKIVELVNNINPSNPSEVFDAIYKFGVLKNEIDLINNQPIYDPSTYANGGLVSKSGVKYCK